ncbi:lysine decarboxylation/transport transcriptional activator CadC [Pseudescherichia vulneris]|uniref:lysine decarboxylation/transport transcriptional activator CadC n=1 Tax=Pseudescherichia vulneris TaxID=566 RepID=UPI00227A9900|nr:lysine decarboxylation/transport transcriptional activator CadC [Pseudescherichia vulneris]WAH52035.1 lysine decarboxylation/transport transcriptional activator CadC [Pseudescherichia vulneris]
MQQPVVYVGEWLVTPSINQISRKGRQLTLEPRLIDLLVFFARHPGQVLTRDELIDNVWTRSVVTGHVVTQSISELRKSLRDGDANAPEYIVTVPKRGYKLTVSVAWSSEEEEASAVTPSVPEVMPEAIPEAASETAPETIAELPSKKGSLRNRLNAFIVWGLFLLALGSCVALVALATIDAHPPVTKTRLLLNPRDIDIHLVDSSGCTNRSTQHAYAVGLGSLITTTLNTFSTYMVHDKTNYNINEPSSSGKTLTIEFVNQRHYRAQQCFMSIKLVDNADDSTMLDKRYFVTSDNQLSIQNDLMASLSEALTQPWPERLQTMLAQYMPAQSTSLVTFYQAHQLLMKGDVDSLGKASELLEEVLKQSPEFIYARAEKALIDVLRHSQQPINEKQLAMLNDEIAQVSGAPGMKEMAILYQIETVDLLGKGNVDEAYKTINKSIDLEMSWIGYVLLGKVYEMKGLNRLAADSYITAFNLRPGDNTLYWIENSVFQTSVTRVVPYLDNFLSKE